MSTAELKLELIRAIDKMPQERLAAVQQFLHSLEKDTKTARPRRRIGALKGGLIYMAPDFDAPLEDFEEYM